MGILEKIKDIEKEVSRTQKNKATEYHLGLLRARLAKLRTQLQEGGSKGGDKKEGFDVSKVGDSRIALIGFPSVGKSTLMTILTNARSEVADYEFTTLTCVPGFIMYNNAKIQLLDLPGIIEGAAHGRGRGRQVIAVAKSSDLILMILDATKEDSQRIKLEKELEAVGIRVNRQPPKITFKIQISGGLSINATLPISVSYQTIKLILHEYKIFNAEMLIKEDCTVDDIIDVIEGNRKYIKCLYVYNKVDLLSIKEIDEIARQPDSVVVSGQTAWNMDILLEQIWERLGLVRVFTKPKGEFPDFDKPIILTAQRGGRKVEDAIKQIHKSLINNFRIALVWGSSVKYSPQHVGLNHELEDEDVIQIMKKI